MVGRLPPSTALLSEAADYVTARHAYLQRQDKSITDGYLELSSAGMSRAARDDIAEALTDAGCQQPLLDREDCNLSACTQVSFHTDLPFAGIFGAWSIAGPARDLVFPRLGIRVRFEPGTLVLFDAAQPHGLLDSGRSRYHASLDLKRQDLTSFASLLLPEHDAALNERLGREIYCKARHGVLPVFTNAGEVSRVDGSIVFDRIQNHPQALCA
jgi:hypothetical protein